MTGGPSDPHLRAGRGVSGSGAGWGWRLRRSARGWAGNDGPGGCGDSPQRKCFPGRGGFGGSWFQNVLGPRTLPGPGSQTTARCGLDADGRWVKSPPASPGFESWEGRGSWWVGGLRPPPPPPPRASLGPGGVIPGLPPLGRRGSFVTVGKSASSLKPAGRGSVSACDVLAPSCPPALLPVTLPGPLPALVAPKWGGPAWSALPPAPAPPP